MHQSRHCDKVHDCVDGSDERYCPHDLGCDECVLPPPAIITLDGKGTFFMTALSPNATCPETHFLCPGDGYCLPVYVRCNGVSDCQGHEDEAGCDSYTCPGFYRCRKSSACLHPDHVCDGISQCPQRDDELLCDFMCPPECVCFGLSFVCRRPFRAGLYPELRYLDAMGSNMTGMEVANNFMLIHLSLARCQLRHFRPLRLPNLHFLDLSDNHLTSITSPQIHALHAPRLRSLNLARNPLTELFPQQLLVEKGLEGQGMRQVLTFSSMLHLQLSGVVMSDFSVTALAIFPELETLNLSYSGLQRVKGEGFQPLTELRVLDIRGCPMYEIQRLVFHEMHKLDTVYADNFKFCCQATLPPGFPNFGCHAPEDSVSSCEALLRSDVYRVCLAVFACLALVGNVGSFFYRVVVKKLASNMGFDVFVTHLCVSDCLMGVYLAVIGVADRLYQGTYLWKDTAWKKSVACQVAGFLSLLSNEVSAFMICLITLERILVIRFPFRNLRFSQKFAQCVCGVAWLVGLSLASVALAFTTTHWHVYGQTGICVPLPIARKDASGHAYSFGVMIVLNFLLFVFIVVGQILIYWSFRSNRMAATDNTRHTGTRSGEKEVSSVARDVTIARRLFTVVMCDFLCWFPVCCLGIMASAGFQVSDEANVGIAVFVLPFNSAFNPFLYTMNVIMEKRREQQEALLRRRLMAEIKRDVEVSATRQPLKQEQNP